MAGLASGRVTVRLTWGVTEGGVVAGSLWRGRPEIEGFCVMEGGGETAGRPEIPAPVAGPRLIPRLIPRLRLGFGLTELPLPPFTRGPVPLVARPRGSAGPWPGPWPAAREQHAIKARQKRLVFMDFRVAEAADLLCWNVECPGFIQGWSEKAAGFWRADPCFGGGGGTDMRRWNRYSMFRARQGKRG